MAASDVWIRFSGLRMSVLRTCWIRAVRAALDELLPRAVLLLPLGTILNVRLNPEETDRMISLFRSV